MPFSKQRVRLQAAAAVVVVVMVRQYVVTRHELAAIAQWVGVVLRRR